MFDKKTKDNGGQVSDFDRLTEELDCQRQKLWELHHERSRIVGQINDYNEKLSEISEKASHKTVSPLTAAAQQMLSGETSIFQASENLQGQIRNLRQQRVIIDEAIRLQEIIISDVLKGRSVSARQLLRPAYRAKILKIAKAVVELSKAISDETAFRTELDRKDISFSIAMGNGATFSRIGALSDPHSRVTIYLSELLRDKWITQAELEAMIKS